MTWTSFFAITWSALVALVVTLLTVWYLLLRRLRLNHHEIWQAFGEPRFFKTTIQKQNDVRRFLRSGDHRQLGDSQIDRLVLLAKVLNPLASLLFVIWVLGELGVWWKG